MYGIGNISNHLSDTLSPSNGLGLVPPMRSRAGNAFEIDYVPIDRIYTDEKNFQNRGDKFSQRSVDSIVNAAKNGTFNWFAFDPITIWENPKDGKKYVLSGHSRTQAFRELSKLRPYIEIDGLTFDRIPAKIYRGSFDDARRLALNSNTLATPETLTERAAYYRNIRKNQNITTPKELKALKEKAIRENNGQMIWDLSFLPEGGISFDSLKAFRLGEQSGSTENFLRLATICQWIGKAFQIYSGLSRAHDRELFNFLMSGGYGSKHGQFFSFSALNERLQKLYEKNVKKLDKMNADGEYTEPFQIAAFKHSSSELDKIAELKKIVDKAYKELQQGIKYVRDAKIPAYINGKENPQFWDYLRGLYYQWINALLEMWKVSEPKEAKQVPSLFGILGINGLGRLVYHNSPYNFNHFDSSKMGSGEGHQIHGWGHYVSATNLTKYGRFAKWQPNDIFDFDALSFDESEDFVHDLRAIASMLIYQMPYEAAEPNQGITPDFVKWWINQLIPYGSQQDQLYYKILLEYIRPHFNRNNYIVEIPDDDGFNYIQEDKPLTEKQWQKIVKALAKQGITSVSEYEIPIGRNAYDFIADSLTDDYNPEAASKFLKKLGFVGIHYFGNVDGEGYVIFDDNDLKIKEHTLYGADHTVNDKPAAVFNCPESELDCRGYKPTYKRLADYSHLIDAADGAKTLKGYGFEKSTLDELVNACKQYKQVERLAAHLKDDDKMQSAFNIWHWLHTNINYNYDTPGEEEIRTPARTWADRKSGVDCDCLAVFTACLLLNMGYNPCFEIVAFNNSPKFSHIYVNLDGAAIDRVLHVFLQRPANITKTKIMEIPVYELSGVGRCDNSLSGVYNSTLAKIQSGTASGDDNNNYRKMQVLVTLKGIDDAAAKLAALLMPYVLTVGDDGVYYFDNSNVAALAKKLDAELKTLKIQGADDTMISNWLSQAATQLKNASGTPDGEDTIVIIINPKGDSTNVQGKMVSTNLQTLSPMSQDAIAQSNNAASSSTLPAVMQTTAAPQEESSGNSTVWWLVGGLVLGLGLNAMAKRR